MLANDFAKEFIAQSIFRMEENTPRIQKCLEQLNEDEVWKRPNDASNSVGNLILLDISCRVDRVGIDRVRECNLPIRRVFVQEIFPNLGGIFESGFTETEQGVYFREFARRTKTDDARHILGTGTQSLLVTTAADQRFQLNALVEHAFLNFWMNREILGDVLNRGGDFIQHIARDPRVGVPIVRVIGRFSEPTPDAAESGRL